MKQLTAIGMSLMVLSSAAVAQDIPVKKADHLSKFEYTKYIASNINTMIGFAYSVNPDCSPLRPINVSITTPPQHGTIELTSDPYYPNYAKDNPRAKCNTSLTTGAMVYYKSSDGYAGPDTADVIALLPGGYAQEIHYEIHVFEPTKIRSTDDKIVGVDTTAKHSGRYPNQ